MNNIGNNFLKYLVSKYLLFNFPLMNIYKTSVNASAYVALA